MTNELWAEIETAKGKVANARAQAERAILKNQLDDCDDWLTIADEWQELLDELLAESEQDDAEYDGETHRADLYCSLAAEDR